LVARRLRMNGLQSSPRGRNRSHKSERRTRVREQLRRDSSRHCPAAIDRVAIASCGEQKVVASVLIEVTRTRHVVPGGLTECRAVDRSVWPARQTRERAAEQLHSAGIHVPTPTSDHDIRRSIAVDVPDAGDRPAEIRVTSVGARDARVRRRRNARRSSSVDRGSADAVRTMPIRLAPKDAPAVSLPVPSTAPDGAVRDASTVRPSTTPTATPAAMPSPTGTHGKSPLLVMELGRAYQSAIFSPT